MKTVYVSVRSAMADDIRTVKAVAAITEKCWSLGLAVFVPGDSSLDRLRQCDAIVLDCDWLNDDTAVEEVELADELGKPVFNLEFGCGHLQLEGWALRG